MTLLHPKLNRIHGAKELIGFQDQPAQMPAAAAGKVGVLRLGFSMIKDRSVLSDLYRVAPLLVQQALYWDEAMPELPICSIISVGGGILQGDRYKIDITVEQGACAHISSQGANRIHQMDANYASQQQTLIVEHGAYLEYLPDFTIPYRTSRFINETEIIVADTATVLYGEMFMSGRKHHHIDERFGFDLLSMSVAVSRPDGTELYTEKTLIEKMDCTVDFPGVMKGYDAFASILCLAPPAIIAKVQEHFEPSFPLDSPRAISGISSLPNKAGVVLRVVGIESYDVRAEVRRFWQIVRQEARDRALPEEHWWR